MIIKWSPLEIFCFLTAHVAKRAKDMFSQASVCRTRGGGGGGGGQHQRSTLARVKGHNTSPPGQGQRSQHLPPWPGSRVTTPPPRLGSKVITPPPWARVKGHTTSPLARVKGHNTPSQPGAKVTTPPLPPLPPHPPPPQTMHRWAVRILSTGMHSCCCCKHL